MFKRTARAVGLTFVVIGTAGVFTLLVLRHPVILLILALSALAYFIEYY